jgi:DinB superfamily
MRTRLELTRHLLEQAYAMASDNLAGLTLEQALFIPQGGYRSILGILKHAAAWSHVYHSYTFAVEPKHWNAIAWPRGRIDTIEPSRDYLDDVIAWFTDSHALWISSLADLNDPEFDKHRPVHWGQYAPLFDIVATIALHHVYHAGEINLLLSLQRGEAWEEGEEVEENHIDTTGHRVRPPWWE